MTKKEKALIDMLWDYMKNDLDYPDRKQTGLGSKTKLGLVLTIQRILNDNQLL